MEMGRTATDFCGQSIANSTFPVFPRYQRAQIPDAIYTVTECSNKLLLVISYQLDVVAVFVFFWGKTMSMRTMAQFCLCQTEESATLITLAIYV